MYIRSVDACVLLFGSVLSGVVLRRNAVPFAEFGFKTATDFSREMLGADSPQASTGRSAVFAKVVFAAGALGWASALGYCFWHYYFQGGFSYGNMASRQGATMSMPCFRGTGALSG